MERKLGSEPVSYKGAHIGMLHTYACDNSRSGRCYYACKSVFESCVRFTSKKAAIDFLRGKK